MPRYNTRDKLLQTFEPLARNYDLIYYAYGRDIYPFINFANLISRENVLNLGIGSAQVAIEAKRWVRSGIYVGINLCKPLLDVSAR
jgi:hypothetical protein